MRVPGVCKSRSVCFEKMPEAVGEFPHPYCPFNLCCPRPRPGSEGTWGIFDLLPVVNKTTVVFAT